MVKIVIENLGQKVIQTTDATKPLLRAIHEAGVDWMTGCGAKGRCTTCKAVIVSGMENLTPVTPAETKYRDTGALGSSERLMCQVRVKGHLVIRVPEEYKLPHLKYTE
jgi:ferredoxin, 2Fe-2S